MVLVKIHLLRNLNANANLKNVGNVTSRRPVRIMAELVYLRTQNDTFYFVTLHISFTLVPVIAFSALRSCDTPTNFKLHLHFANLYHPDNKFRYLLSIWSSFTFNKLNQFNVLHCFNLSILH